jgi:dTDP-4-amino-4,6-dideoxy-D-galactose acyltransferase
MGVTSKSVFTPSAELLTWDSEFWSVRIGRANTLMDEWAMQNTVGCMWLLIPAADQAGVHRAESAGARVMDVRVKLARGTSPEFMKAREVEPRDTDALVGIARKAFRGLTRFYADPRFPDERCDDLYENWVHDSLAGWAAEILVAEDRKGRVQGFITVHLDADVASIGLIAVAEQARGKGIGLDLTRSAAHWAFMHAANTITVVTQGVNIPAQRCFQRAGFVTTQTDYWLHQWL